MVYTGSFGGVSNQEDWTATIFTITDDSTNAPFSIAGAEILMRLCREGNSAAAIISAQTDDGSITIAADGFSFSWDVPQATMSQLRPEVYNVFVRAKINGIWSQLVSASLTVIDGGPSS